AKTRKGEKHETKARNPRDDVDNALDRSAALPPSGQQVAPRMPHTLHLTPHTSHLRYTYVAYPMSLTLKAANAIQTYHTARELRRLLAARGDELQVIVPRWLREASRFADPEVAARHLPRIPFNKFTRFWKGSGWSYLERT